MCIIQVHPPYDRLVSFCKALSVCRSKVMQTLGQVSKSHAQYQAKQEIVSARRHLARENNAGQDHTGTRTLVLKRFISTTVRFFLFVVYIPKKVQNKTSTSKDQKSHQNKDTLCFIFISIQAFFPYIYTYSLNQSDKHQNLSVAFSFMTTFYILNPEYVLLFSSIFFLQYTPTHAVIQLGRDRCVYIRAGSGAGRLQGKKTATRGGAGGGD